MKNYPKDKLIQATTVIESLLHKCEKSMLKLRYRTSQHTLLKNRIEALKIALELIESEIENKWIDNGKQKRTDQYKWTLYESDFQLLL